MDPMTISLLLQAAPIAINALSSLFGRGQSSAPAAAMSSMPQMTPTMTWDQALQQAQGQMAPLLRRYDTQAMQRGFYGQLPSDVARSDYAASTQSQMANQFMQQDWQNKFNQQQLAADWALKQGSLDLGQQQLNQQQQQFKTQNAYNLGNMAGNWYQGMAQLTGKLPFTDEWTVQRKQEVADQLGRMTQRGGYQLSR